MAGVVHSGAHAQRLVEPDAIDEDRLDAEIDLPGTVERLWVSALSNESFGYLPTTKILAEGGHETIGLTLDIGLFSPGTEDTVIRAVRRLAEETGRKSPAEPP